jgi:hypothetical protein
MKFLFPEDKQLYEWELKKDGGDSDKFINRRKGLIAGLKDFRKSQRAKSSWRNNKWIRLAGIKRFHKSTEGKRFHRALGKFLSGRYTRQKTASQGQRENYELMMALSSLLTHSLLECEYYMPSVINEVIYEEFCDWIGGEISEILTKITNETFDFSNYEETLLRLVEPSVLFDSLACDMVTSEKEIVDVWNKEKEDLITSGKKEEEDGFYTKLMALVKEKICL